MHYRVGTFIQMTQTPVPHGGPILLKVKDNKGLDNSVRFGVTGGAAVSAVSGGTGALNLENGMRREEPNDKSGERHVSPSAERNKGAIGDVLKRVMPDEGLVVEISSGTGQHIVHFAREMPHLTWQPSERDEVSLRSIARWVEGEGLTNVLPAVRLDVTETPWLLASAAAVVCLNMIHIAPWTAGEALIRGASDILVVGGPLFLYGPFRRGGRHTAPSNEAFDQSLRARNPAWGIRNLEEVATFAAAHGFGSPEVLEMPANNLSVVFRRQ